MSKNMNFLNSLILVLPMISYAMLDNLLSIWIFMELQTLCFILFMWNSGENKKNILFFLLIQMLASLLVFIFICLKSKENLYWWFNYFFFCSLVLKMGMVPFHQWAFGFIKHLGMQTLFLFLTLMKFIPFFFMLQIQSDLCMVFIFLNMVAGFGSVFFFSMYKDIIFFSSLFMGGTLMNFCFNSNVYYFVLSMLFYTLILFFLILSLLDQKSSHVYGTGSVSGSLFLLLSVLTMLGMPYLMGFLMKLLVMQAMLSKLSLMMLLLLGVGSVTMSFFYMKVLYFYFCSLQVELSGSLEGSTESSNFILSVIILISFLFPLGALLGMNFIFYLK